MLVVSSNMSTLQNQIETVLGSRFRERQHGLLQDPDELIFPVLGDQWTGSSPALQHDSPHTTATPESLFTIFLGLAP